MTTTDSWVTIQTHTKYNTTILFQQQLKTCGAEQRMNAIRDIAQKNVQNITTTSTTIIITSTTIATTTSIATNTTRVKINMCV